MALSHSGLESKPLIFPVKTVGELMITVERINHYTYSVVVKRFSTGETLLNVPLDPMDNTCAGTVSADETVMRELSTYLSDHLGTKEFLISSVKEIPGFTPIEESKVCDRVRIAKRADLFAQTTLILDEHKELVAELDATYKFVIDEESLLEGFDEPTMRYRELCAFLDGHAKFTPEKMLEYKEESIYGMKARFKNNHVRPFVLVHRENNQIYGTLRVLYAGDKNAYLSDEAVNQEILPGKSGFLLAYLMNKVCQSSLLMNQENLFIIAAKDRVSDYEKIGLQKSLPGVNAQMRFEAPKPVMTAIKGKLMTRPRGYSLSADPVKPKKEEEPTLGKVVP